MRKQRVFQAVLMFFSLLSLSVFSQEPLRYATVRASYWGGGFHTVEPSSFFPQLAQWGGYPQPILVKNYMNTEAIADTRVESNRTALISAIQSQLGAGNDLDFILYQENSTGTSTSMWNGVANVQAHIDKAVGWTQVAQAVSPGATLVLHPTWAHPRSYTDIYNGTRFLNGPSDFQNEANAAYEEAKDTVNSTFGAGTALRTKTGEAWAIKDWTNQLYRSWGSGAEDHHGSVRGEVFVTMVAYASVYQSSVSELYYKNSDVSGTTPSADKTIFTSSANGTNDVLDLLAVVNTDLEGAPSIEYLHPVTLGDWQELAHIVDRVTFKLGDANLDGFVGDADYIILTNNLDTSPGPRWSSGDFNGDGVVDALDMAIWVANEEEPAPIITAQPSGMTLYEGASTTLTVSATSSGGALTYQWHEGVSGNTNSFIASATNASYITPVFDTVGDYPYWARVADTNGSTDSATATITVITPDITSPEAITNLSVSAQTSSSITLAWSAPDDVGFGADNYDIRYSKSAITTGNFDSASAVAAPPAPASPGSAESFTVTGLDTESLYYFAIKTTDAAENESEISNIASNSTLPAAAGLLHYEGFDYGDPGGNYNMSSGYDGGTGWAGPWAKKEAGSGGDYQKDIALAYTSGVRTLVSAGGSMRPVNNGLYYYRSLDEIYSGASGDRTLWLSLIGYGTANTGYRVVELINSANDVIATGAAQRLAVGNNNSGTQQWQIGVDRYGAGTASGVAISTNSAAADFILIKIEMKQSADDMATMWVNPSLDSEPIGGGVSYTKTSTQWTFDTFRIMVGGPSTLGLDEIRIGETWSDVTLNTGGEVLPTQPEINTQPASITIDRNESTTLSVAATASAGDLAYQWYEGFSGNPDSPIASATNAIYTTPVFDTIGSYRHWVAVTDDNGTTNSATATVTVVLPVSTDDDTDGLPNDWETTYFGGATNANPDATAANGINTVLEAYIAGLNPTSTTSRLTVDALQPLRWSAVSGRVYSVFWTSNLLNDFQTLETNLTGGAFTDLLYGAESEGFYRIDVQLAP